jgi:uncharacterized delta-60 repeat protein
MNLRLPSTFLLSAICCAGNFAFGNAGGLDSSFGTAGLASADFGADYVTARDMVAQKDGKLVVVGVATTGGDSAFVLARFTPDGRLDTTFNGTGMVTTDFGATDDNAKAVTIQPDGKIVAAGWSADGIAIARYLPDGRLDASFGGTGKVTQSFASGAYPFSVAVQADGKLVLAGAVRPSALYINHVAVFRFGANGALDTSFGTGGMVETDLGRQFQAGVKVLVQADGRLVVPASNSTGTIDAGFAIVRYKSDGSLDPTFGTGGKVITEFGPGQDLPEDAVLQSDGKIVVAGQYDGGSASFANYSFAAVRYNTDGSLDSSFGTGGKVTTFFFGASRCHGLALQKDGRLVLVGEERDNYPALVRYKRNGTLDAGFGTGGQASPATFSACVRVVVQPDGKMVVAGTDLVNPQPRMKLFRLFGRSPAPDFDLNGSADLVVSDPGTGRSNVEYLQAGTFVSVASGPGIPAGWRVAKVRDFDGDAKPDYFLVKPATGALVVWKLNDTVLSGAVTLPSLPAGWQLAAVADMNSDDKPDLVLSNPATGSLAVWLLDGARLASATHFTQGGVNQTLPPGWQVAGAANFNGDAKPDLLLYNPATRQTTVWYLNGTVVTGVAAGPTIASGWSLAGVADFNGDDQPDFLIYHAATRRCGIWILKGLSVTNATYIVNGAGAPITQPAGWELVAP